MDSSESLTQANDDRDYETERHAEHRPSSALGASFHDDGPFTLLDDDTGAVNFGPLSPDEPRPTSQLSDMSPVIVDLKVRRGSWRDQRESQNEDATTPRRPAIAPPPETPVGPVNPFQNKVQGSILRATQLFNATQFSSAVKAFSPTSSRPSPRAFPQPFMSTSPADLGTSPLKHRYPQTLSSPSAAPLKLASTPLAFPTSPPAAASTPRPARTADDDHDGAETIPESPPPPETVLPHARKRRRQELLGEYEPVAASQERKFSSGVLDAGADSDPSDRDEQQRRRQRARRKREHAERQLDAYSSNLSMGAERPLKRVASSAAMSSSRERSEERLRNSASSNTLPSRIPQSSPPVRLHQSGGIADATSSRVLIPESPVAVPESDCALGVASDDVRETTPEHTTVTEETPRPTADNLPSTQPLPSKSNAGSSPPLRLELPSTEPLPNSNTGSSPSPPPDLASTQLLLPEYDVGSSPSPAPSTRRSPNPPVEGGTQPPASPGSTLSPLTTTPSPVASPEATTMSPSPETDCYDLPSSTAFDLPPPRPSRRAAQKTYSRPFRRRSRAASRPGCLDPAAPDNPESPDELASAPVRKPRRSRSAKRSEERGGGGLFENMAFAISFQERRDGEDDDAYAARCEVSEELAGLVRRAGARVLAEGFGELLGNKGVDARGGVEISAAPAAGGEVGFAALLADGHSRKVKYMQALALGVPCLAYQWATASLAKGTPLDWAPYLLGAGNSEPCGGAVLSQRLVPYPACSASLREVFARRALLLGGGRVLLVMRKGAEAADAGKRAYLLLVRIAGATVRRAFSVREARKALGRGGFEWVYVDEETGSVGEVLGVGKKGKKGWREGVRWLSNEVIVQSLIAGRVVDEAERDAHGLGVG